MSADQKPQNSTTRLGHADFRLLYCLSESGGWTSGQLARQMGYSNVRSFGQHIRRDLLRMQTLGWVAPMDGAKPVCWVRTKAGTEALNV